MHRLVLPCFVAFCFSFSLACSVREQATPKSSVGVLMSSPLLSPPGQVSAIRIADIDRDSRQARLTFRDGTGPDRFTSIPQGEAILLIQNERTCEFTQTMRVNVFERLENGQARISFGPVVAGILEEGPVLAITPYDGLINSNDPAPKPVSTRRLRELPELIPISKIKGRVNTETEESLRIAAIRGRSINNLTRISTAIYSFHVTHGHFPPAVIYGPDGKPWHSWRVLLLPFLDQVSLYEKYDFSQPWDAPANKAVVETVVDVYKDPIYGRSDDALTHYAVLVGEEAMFKPHGAKITDLKNPLKDMKAGARGIDDMTDGQATTIAVVPVADDRKIPWARPEDISFGPDFPAIGEPGGIAAPYPSPDGNGRIAPIAFADGRVRQIKSLLDTKTLRPMITFRSADPARADASDFEVIEARRHEEYRMIQFVKSPKGEISAVID